MNPKAEGSYYIVIPGHVRSDARLSSDAKLLYGEIASKCNLRGYCWATNNFFAEILFCNARSVQRYIKELEDCGHIKVLVNQDAAGTNRQIFLSHYTGQGVTEQTQGGATDLSDGGTTDLAQGDNTSVTPPHDTSVAQNTLTSLLIKDIIIPALPDGKAAVEPEPVKKVVRKKKQEPGPATLYTRFIDVYDQWFKNNNDGTPPKIDGANGNAAKSLISYFRKIVTQKEGKGLDEPTVDGLILDTWAYILESWDLLEQWLRDKTRLIDINSRIQDILKHIKNAKNRKPFTASKHTNHGKGTGAQQLASLLFDQLQTNSDG